ncbi:MAG: ChaN family lipoprotein [Phycisphaerales bacterium]|nr:ChaN family lipoprotein [Phycisphaerales bacterium]
MSVNLINIAPILDGGTFDGATGERVSRDDIIARAKASDVIILGETHNDAEAHAIQRHLTEVLLNDRPGGALALEMLERDEQVLVDDFTDGLITADEFAKLTNSSSWAGAGTWAAWYQPILSAAEYPGAKIIAANAPRRYVKIARTDGYNALRALPPDRAQFIKIPDHPITGQYVEKFREVMQFGDDDGIHAGMDDEMIDSMMRSQFVWDATMADSIAQARAAGAAPVILLIGQFHVDFEGGTVQYLREARPTDRILTISMQPVASDMLREEDRGRADIIVYTK